MYNRELLAYPSRRGGKPNLMTFFTVHFASALVPTRSACLWSYLLVLSQRAILKLMQPAHNLKMMRGPCTYVHILKMADYRALWYTQYSITLE